MKPSRTRLLLVLALFIILLGIITIFFWDFVRETIAIPIYYLLWVVDLTLKSISQQVYLGILIIVSLIIAINTLRKAGIAPPRSEFIEDRRSTTSRYVIWRKMVNNLSISAFSREQFVQEARKLILSILAYQEGVTVPEIELMTRNGTLPLPEAIQNLLQRQALQVAEPPPATIQQTVLHWRDRLLGGTPPPDPHLDQQVNEIIQFIEQQLELTNARN